MKINQVITEAQQNCPECGGPAFSDLLLAEKKDACYNKVRSRYKVWPSAYASGALVQCRKKGASNWGNKSKNESVAEGEMPPRPTPLSSKGAEAKKAKSKEQFLKKKEAMQKKQGVAEGIPDVDHMHGPRGINLPVADTRDLLQKPFEYYGNYKEWYRDVNRVNSELLDGNAEYTTTAGGKIISINGKDFAFWNNRNGNGSIDIGIAKKHSGQGVAEAKQDLTTIPTERLKAYLNKNYGGGVPAFGTGAMCRRVMAELKRRGESLDEGLGKDLKRLATGKDVKSRAGQEIAKAQQASMTGDNKTAHKHFKRYDRLDKLANKGVAEGSVEDKYKGGTPWNGKMAARNAHRLGKTYTNPINPKYHKAAHAEWEKEYNNEMARLKKKGVAETSLKQRAKTTLRKLDPTIKGRLKDRADDEFDFGLEKDNSDWMSGAPGSAHMKHSAHLRRLAKGEKPFQDKKGVAESNPVDSDGYDVDREDAGEYDYEGDQAKDQLQTIVAAARKLDDILDDNENMPEWVQMKITKATDYLDTAADYIAANKAQAEPMAEANPEKIGGRHDPQDFDDMVLRLKKLAGAGPMKTVYDPNTRRYKNIPTAVQPGDKK